MKLNKKTAGAFVAALLAVLGVVAKLISSLPDDAAPVPAPTHVAAPADGGAS